MQIIFNVLVPLYILVWKWKQIDTCHVNGDTVAANQYIQEFISVMKENSYSEANISEGWANHTADGEASSIFTNEVFKVKEIDKVNMIQERVSYHVNFIGNKGSHYIMSATFNWSTGIITIDKAVCVENGRKK